MFLSFHFSHFSVNWCVELISRELGSEPSLHAPLPPLSLSSVHWSRGGRRVQQAMLVWLMAAASHGSRLSLMVLQVSSRDWGPVLGTDIDRMESGTSDI